MKAFLIRLVPILLVIIFFGGSILIHEIGHYVLAKKRGLFVPKFSIGFGPKIFGFKVQETEFVISLLPFGGYVAIPQLADLHEIEGKFDLPDDAKPATCCDKVIAAFAGPLANMLLAFGLAIVIYFIGLPVLEEELTTTVGYVAPMLTMHDGNQAQSPASKAGILPNDKILSVDGHRVKKFDEIVQFIALGNKKDNRREPLTTLEIERDGVRLQVSVNPVLISYSKQQHDAFRVIGVHPKQTLIVSDLRHLDKTQVLELKKGDRLVSANGVPLFHVQTLRDMASKNGTIAMGIERNGNFQTVNVPVVKLAVRKPFCGLAFSKKRLKLDFIPADDDIMSLNQDLRQNFSRVQIFCSSEKFLEKNGISNGDQLVALGGNRIFSLDEIGNALRNNDQAILRIFTKSGERELSIEKITDIHLSDTKFDHMCGIVFEPHWIIHRPTPVQQIVDSMDITFKTLGSLFSKSSSISAKHLMGPAGLIKALHTFAKDSFLALLCFVILINVNLAILNLLPLPVLDGGIITIALLERFTTWKSLNKVLAKVQIVFFALLVALLTYVTFFDFRRMWAERQVIFENQRESRLIIHHDR
ncbi:MAG: site-2 protease family protein [Puniceicoccales bacterium]|jgi:RIP metalloprotease RseP|nr:site-2 protease family protein [Puniceicoccales bacterium]